jgi:hypothetical protein
MYARACRENQKGVDKLTPALTWQFAELTSH